jgi:hypothetical protein
MLKGNSRAMYKSSPRDDFMNLLLFFQLEPWRAGRRELRELRALGGAEEMPFPRLVCAPSRLLTPSPTTSVVEVILHF